MVHLASLIILRGCAHNPLPAQGILFQATATSIVSMDPQNQGVVKYFPEAAIHPRAKSYSSCFFWGVCEVRMKNWTKCSGFYPVQSLLSLFIPSLAIAQQEFFPKATTSSPPPTGFVSVYGQRLKVMKWQLTERIFFCFRLKTYFKHLDVTCSESMTFVGQQLKDEKRLCLEARVSKASKRTERWHRVASIRWPCTRRNVPGVMCRALSETSAPFSEPQCHLCTSTSHAYAFGRQEERKGDV